MSFRYFSLNGELLPADQAVVPLSDIEYAYGFGVYESVRVSKGKPRFADEHCARLMLSAEAIGLAHDFTPTMVEEYIEALIAANEVDTCNLKIMLIGGKTPHLYIQCLAPRFVDRKLYKTG
ncbi:aminotransferase class IV, partial [Candidatus Saccharibacteria bacterium]|nr:aminotransferase class IV [Candidatus Saccharibacteria bacterium]